MADVELIALALEVLRKLGIEKVELRLSHAGLTRGILQKLGLNSEEQTQVFDRLLDGDASALSQIKTERPELVPLLDLHGKSSGFVKNLAASLSLNIPELKSEIEDFVFIADSLHSLGCPYQIDMASVRGFEYYTGIIFQLYVNDQKIGGGGRYDALIPSMSGKATPASGFALYLDVLMDLINLAKLAPVQEPKIMIKMDPGATATGFAAADSLRAAGYVVKLHLGGKGPADTHWKLDVHSQTPNLVLTDTSRHKKYELKSVEEVLKTLG
jgi:histidyl-tRNA synthetase